LLKVIRPKTMSGKIKILNSILDEIDNGFIVLKMVFGEKMVPEDFTIVHVNVPFEEITGISFHDYTGINASKIDKDLTFLGFDWKEEYSLLAAEQKFRHRDKYLIPNEIHLRIKTFIPQTGFLVMILSDISSMKSVEKDSGSNDVKFRTLLEKCADGFLFFSANEMILSASANIQDILGYSEEELKSLTDMEFLKNEDKQKVRDAIRHILMNPRIAGDIEFEVIKKDMTRSWFEGTLHNMLLAKGVNSIVLKIKEITRRKEEEISFFRNTSRLLSDYPI
jgi:PAS domain S-box-containing protein